MNDAFIGEIRLMGCNYAPDGWALCDGAELDVSRNQALFSVIGHNFGGSGTRFNLPNLQGTAAMGTGTGPGRSERNIGSVTGTETVALDASQMPAHNHNFVLGSRTASARTASPATGAARSMATSVAKGSTAILSFVPNGAKANGQIAGNAMLPAGEGKPHENRQPYVAMNYCICVDGEYPIRP